MELDLSAFREGKAYILRGVLKEPGSNCLEVKFLTDATAIDGFESEREAQEYLLRKIERANAGLDRLAPGTYFIIIFAQKLEVRHTMSVLH